MLVQREGNAGKTGSWTGPYNLLSLDNETCVIDIPSGYTSFRSIVVKLFYTQELDQSIGEQSPKHQYNSELNSNTIEVQIPEPEVESAIPPKRGRPRK